MVPNRLYLENPAPYNPEFSAGCKSLEPELLRCSSCCVAAVCALVQEMTDSALSTPLSGLPALFERQDSEATMAYWKSQSKTVIVDDDGEPIVVTIAKDQVITDTAPDISAYAKDGKFSDILVICNDTQYKLHRYSEATLCGRF